MENTEMTEYEMQDKFLNENMDVLHKYLLWKETILPAQVVTSNVDFNAEDVEYEVIEGGTSGNSITDTVKNYGIID